MGYLRWRRTKEITPEKSTHTTDCRPVKDAHKKISQREMVWVGGAHCRRLAMARIRPNIVTSSLHEANTLPNSFYSFM